MSAGSCAAFLLLTSALNILYINYIEGIMMRRRVMRRRAFVIIFFILFFASYYGDVGTLTPVNAQQNGMSSSTSAVNWEEDKETILKILNKVRSKEIISDEDYEKIRDALEDH